MCAVVGDRILSYSWDLRIAALHAISLQHSLLVLTKQRWADVRGLKSSLLLTCLEFAMIVPIRSVGAYLTCCAACAGRCRPS